VKALSDILSDESPLDVLMARQPIYSKNQDIVAFALLFRGQNLSNITDEMATLDVITNSYASLTVGAETRQLPCYLKVTDKILLTDQLPPLPPAQFTLELLGRSVISNELVEKVSDLVRKGYRIVLSDYDPDDSRFRPLLNLVNIVKLDIQALGMDRLASIIQALKPFQLDLQADKVETKEQFRQCLELGFQFYQGYFLSHPEPVKGRKVRGNKIVLMQLLTELNREEATGASLEQVAINDPALTYKILKVVNSAAMGPGRKISSLSHAITLLGIDQMRRWVMLFLATANDGKPNSLTRSLLIRGRMCELMASILDYQDPMNYFIVGLLSQIDALLDQPLAELLQDISLEDEIKNALLTHEGNMGQILKDVIAYERGQFDALSGMLPKSHYEVAYRHSLNWSDSVYASLQGG
jgi:EAL and modified HD-GYP domain-containing signal transduction protein